MMRLTIRAVRILCIITVTLSVFVSAVQAYALSESVCPESREAVSDYSQHWAAGYIDYVIEQGYMGCVYESGEDALYCSFMPDEPVTRAEFAVSLAALSGVRFPEISYDTDGGEAADGYSDPEDEENRESGDDEEIYEWGFKAPDTALYEPDTEAFAVRFADVDGSEPYAQAAAWAVENGILNGTGDNFSPEGIVDRQTLAVIIHRSAGVLGINACEDWSVMIDYSDLDQVPEWAVEGIAYCTVTGLMHGGSDGRFMPGRALTRSECAAVLVRLSEYMNEPCEASVISC